MKILQVISSAGVKSGGTSSCLYTMINGIDKYNFDVLSFELESDDKLPGVFNRNVNLIYVPKVNNGFYYSSEYKKKLQNNSSSLIHVHGLWQYPGYAAARSARKKNIPYLITPHGMLYPQAINHSKMKKELFLKLFLLKDLNKASAIHATCSEEMQHLRNLQVKAPIAIIPNSVSISHLPQKKDKSPKKQFGYLGRVHPRKNIDKLIYAFDSIEKNNPDVKLMIIGDGDKEYMSFLKSEVERLNLKNVHFTGFLSGDEKEKAISSLDFLVVPSDFENFGMIIAEALVREIPVIASKGTPWKDLEDYNCGWWVDNDVETLTNTLFKALSLPDNEKEEMGKKGRNLILEKYSPEVVATQIIQLYSWMLGKGDKPEFVYLD